VDSGARNVDHILSHTVLPELSRLVLERISTYNPFNRVCMTVDPRGEFVFHFQSPSLG
jgi:type VI secretion system protein VasG